MRKNNPKKVPSLVCVDSCAEHLTVVKKLTQKLLIKSDSTPSVESTDHTLDIDTSFLKTINARFPFSHSSDNDSPESPEFSQILDELNNQMSTILACRILHFLDPRTELRPGLRQLHSLLRPGGKLFIVTETPFIGNLSEKAREKYKKFSVQNSKTPRINDIDKNSESEWPGLITDFDEQDNNRGPNLPKLLHLFDGVVMERELVRAGFIVENLRYLDRRGDFPEFLHLDGRESLGVIARKPFE